MRFDTVVHFCRDTDDYDPIEHRYLHGYNDEQMIRANVTDLSNDRLNELFGNLSADAKVIRLRRSFDIADMVFDYVTFNDDRKQYKVVRSINPRERATMIVSEKYG